jgi:mono/diheme cytochrome c family protein
MLALVMLTTACGSSDGEQPAGADGQALYETRHDDGNTFACSTCHALAEPTADGITRPGHPIGDAALRASYKNGQLTRFIDAVNACRQDWLFAPAFEESDPRWTALEGYLRGVAEAAGGPAEAPALSFDIVDPPTDIMGGDHTVGETTFNTSCVVCHGQSAVGTERAPAIAGTMLDGDFVALKIRRSGNAKSAIYPDLTPGRMPFWAADRLSDGQLRDIIAFLAMSEPAIEIEDNTGDQRIDLSQANAQEGCAMSHVLVGQTLSFSTRAHAVAGSATVIDDCTLHLDDFSFDGGGIDVRVLGGSGGNYANGASLTVNMVGNAFTGGAALIRLPTGVSLDQFDGLSVWCVPVGFSFGDGQF